MKLTKIKLNLVFILSITYNVSFSQPIRTYFIDLGISSTTSYDKNKLDFTALFPFNNRYSFQLGYSPIKHLAFYGSYQNQNLEKYSLLRRSNSYQGEVNTINKSSSFLIGGYIYLFEQKPKEGRKPSKNDNRIKFLLEGKFGFSNNSSQGDYQYNLLQNSSSNFIYNSIIGSVHFSLLSRIGEIKFSNIYTQSNYRKIYFSGPAFQPDRIYYLQSWFQQNPRITSYLSEVSFKIKVKWINILVGGIVNHNFHHEFKRNGKELVVIYSGINLGISSIRKK